MPEKEYIPANSLLIDSFRLAKKVWDSGFRPNFLIGIWRGGTPPGIAVQEFFRKKGLDPYHTAIKTQSYSGIKAHATNIDIKGMEHVIDIINSEDKLLIVDDVSDTGETLKALIAYIKAKARKNTPVIKTAVVYYKPVENTSGFEPDYYVHKTAKWLFFPHEINDMNMPELRKYLPEVWKMVVGEKGL